MKVTPFFSAARGVLALLSLAVAPAFARADVVVRHDGSTIEGRVVSVDAEADVVETGDARSRVARADVAQIRFGPVIPVLRVEIRNIESDDSVDVFLEDEAVLREGRRGGEWIDLTPKLKDGNNAVRVQIRLCSEVSRWRIWCHKTCYMAVNEVLHTMNTTEIARSILTYMPGQVVSANGAYYIYGQQTTVLSNSHTIANGVTDSGWRVGFTAECYSIGADFAGTLAKQIGCQVRYGQGSASATGTITNSTGLHLQAYNLGGTITQQWGIFQENVSSANAVNLFNGYTRISPGLTNPPVHLFELIANDTVTNGTMRVYQVRGPRGALRRARLARPRGPPAAS